MEVLGAQDVPEGGLGQQPGNTSSVMARVISVESPRAVVGVLHVSHRDGGV